MSKSIDIDYEMFEIVAIKGLEINGMITGIHMNGNNLTYTVEYWFEGIAQNVNCYSFELEVL